MGGKAPIWLIVILIGVLLGLLAVLLLTRCSLGSPPSAPEPVLPVPTETPEPRPEPTPEPRPEPPSPPPATGEPSLAPEAEALLRALVQEQPGRWSLCWMRLPDGETVAVSTDEEAMVSASLIKLYVMGAVFERVESGELEREAVMPLLRPMIVISDNASANQLIRLLGGGDAAAGMAAVNDWCRDRGYAATRLNRLMLEDNGLQNYTAAADCAALLAAIYRGECVSEEASRQMLDLLLEQQVNDRLPLPLPEGTPVAHKTGDLSGLCCADVGIVFSPGGDYLLCAICNDQPYDAGARDAIVGLSGQLYALLNGGEK